MCRSGFDNHFTQTRLADYLASGAIVVNEGFLEALLDLPKSASKLCAKLGQPGMADNQTGDFFSTGELLGLWAGLGAILLTLCETLTCCMGIAWFSQLLIGGLCQHARAACLC